MHLKKARNALSEKDAPRYSTAPNAGLTSEQVRQRNADGLNNVSTQAPSRTVGQILRSNLFTLFNFMNFALAAIVLAVGSYKNATFICVILCNIVIGTVQEFRSKRTVEKLQLLSAPTASVVRDGKEQTIKVEELVLDDVAVWRTGMQISADCTVLEGAIEANESLLTGESKPQQKRAGDALMSGSFVVSGECRARVEHVGDESYAVKLASEARKFKRPNSELMRSLNLIIRFVSVIIVPMGVGLFLKQHYTLGQTFTDSVVSTVAAMIGMIPEGLILLTSIALAVSVIRLAQRRTLVQQLYCIETLARVDVLCLDKTGTITSGDMQVKSLEPVGCDESRLRGLMCALTHCMKDDNPTSRALNAYFTDASDWKCAGTVAFSSARKWSGASFEGHGSVVMGAPEFVLRGQYAPYRAQVERYAADGCRVLVVATFDGALNAGQASEEPSLPGSLTVCGFILIGDHIREDAPQTLKFFHEQGVELKVISGDNPVTVAEVARRAGLTGADKYVDAATLKTDAEVIDAATKINVFGRVTPQQKRVLVRALKDAGHTVAMTGDGVNDVLALKDADCSIAMASGSDAARQVANLVLLDSNFASLPHVVAEGRRVINNIQRSAALFLTKTLFSFMLSLVTLILLFGYPFEPIQLTLFSTFAIGLPSFVLALQPNTKRIQGNFLINVISRAFPAAFTIAAGVTACMCLGGAWGLSSDATSTMAILYTAAVGMLSLLRVCWPLNALRAALIAVCVGGYVLGITLFPGFFMIAPLGADELRALAIMVAAAIPCLWGLGALIGRINPEKLSKKKR